jgi:hypothetical protein
MEATRTSGKQNSLGRLPAALRRHTVVTCQRCYGPADERWMTPISLLAASTGSINGR